MKYDTLLRSGFTFYLLVGYVSAYYYAKRSTRKTQADLRRSSLARAGSWALIVLMPFCAASALYGIRDILLAPLLIGATINVFWFYSGCSGLLQGTTKPHSTDRQKDS